MRLAFSSKSEVTNYRSLDHIWPILVLKALSSDQYLDIRERYIKIHVKIGYVASLEIDLSGRTEPFTVRLQSGHLSVISGSHGRSSLVHLVHTNSFVLSFASCHHYSYDFSNLKLNVRKTSEIRKPHLKQKGVFFYVWNSTRTSHEVETCLHG